MAVPKYDEMYNDFLITLVDGKEHDIKEIREIVAKKKKLTDEDLKETLHSGKCKYFNRIGWTATYLKKAGLINSVKRGMFNITDEGNKIITNNERIDNNFLLNYDSFKEFKDRNTEPIKIKEMNSSENEIELTPQEKIEKAIQEINNELEDNLLEEILKQSSDFFEELSVKLLLAMGYGKAENAVVTPKTGDYGIDGFVLEDELGINTIFIQAKRYDKDNSVSRPEIQKFAGAMLGKNAKKGVFITTSYFAKPAIDYANNQNIILIDGSKLVQLMIKYNVGCYTENSYSIKKLDLDFFENI
jgi:restriction endonuclease